MPNACLQQGQGFRGETRKVFSPHVLLRTYPQYNTILQVLSQATKNPFQSTRHITRSDPVRPLGFVHSQHRRTPSPFVRRKSRLNGDADLSQANELRNVLHAHAPPALPFAGDKPRQARCSWDPRFRIQALCNPRDALLASRLEEHQHSAGCCQAANLESLPSLCWELM